MSRLILGFAFSTALLAAPEPKCMAGQSPDPAAGRDLRRAVKAALTQPLAKDANEQAAQARELLALHAKITARESLTTSERERLLTRLRGRLGRLAKALARGLADKRANESKASDGLPSVVSTSRSTSASTSASTSDLAQAPPNGAAGGASQTDAQSLIDLIQATIAPSSWDVNGGRGSIVYWPLGQALVVRQTSELHEQLGGVVGRLRK